MLLDAKAIETLSNITTATLTTVLLKLGLRNTWIRGVRPLAAGQHRVVGPAFTLRFVPAREDLATPASWSSPCSTRAAIEAMPPGCIAVVDAFGTTDAGVWGDILCERMVKKDIKALVTDGVVRDARGVAVSGLPSWSQGYAAPASVTSLTFVGWNEPIGCGGVAIFPGDIIVADEDGAIVIPIDYLNAVLEQAPEQEMLEAWVIEQVRAGHPLIGLYPPNAENLQRYQAYKSSKGQ
ncbi:ribonuclease activity regulator RraA [Paenalcaligenes niemegkensis]|uniref:ribonuclease activity regulator RraA n=1 Tax=Paenalcaligenes niemegkensis TaxID=2895469 RepID=UPI001EE82082|nr:ribonuclease activity regulator RraA [Paenalcaligenes niemegkensis]MCQ9618058.1 ribonuclease activity regulator RraA [Paenalcaligenes niemegkensis]